MPKITEIEFQGASGQKHKFQVYTLGTKTFNSVGGGVYIFTKQAQNRNGETRYYPLYIGQTNSFKDRLTTSHERWPCAVQNEVNCLCVLVEENTFSRKAIELDLLSRYNTPCNRNGW